MRIGVKKNKKLKIVLDANWYVSACISRKSRRTVYHKILKHPHLHTYYSPELMAEFDDVINRPKFVKIVSPKHVNRFKGIALKFLNKTHTGVVPAIVRDADDNCLLGICESCQADFLITGDKDLLVLAVYQETEIVTMGQFLQMSISLAND